LENIRRHPAAKLLYTVAQTTQRSGLRTQFASLCTTIN